MFAHKSVSLTFKPSCHSPYGKTPIFPQLQESRTRFVNTIYGTWHLGKSNRDLSNDIPFGSGSMSSSAVGSIGVINRVLSKGQSADLW